MTIKKIPIEFLYHAILLVAFVATVGSLFFSEIMDLPPCVLCWYQRISIYPVIILALVGILRSDKNMPIYVLSLVIPGTLISIYHNFLYWNVLPESAAVCSTGVSCTVRYIEWFGFITIPLLALVTFLLLIALSWMCIVKNKQESHE